MAPTLFTLCNALPPEGPLRLRPGEVGSAALAGLERPLPCRLTGLALPGARATAYKPEYAVVPDFRTRRRLS